MRAVLAGFGLLCIAMLTGCIALGINPGDLELNGKVGWACSAPVGVVGVALDVVCVPVSVPVGVIVGAVTKNDCAWFYMTAVPGFTLELAAYSVGWALAYPVQLAAVDVPRAIRSRHMANAAGLSGFIDMLPDISKMDYKRLVELSGREFAPAYRAERLPLPFGAKPHLDWNVAEDWHFWNKAGRPPGGPQEAAVVLGYWIMQLEPGTAEPCFGEAQLEVIERAAGVDRRQVELYEEQHEEARRDGRQGPWNFWITEHGGVEAVAKRSVNPKDVGE